MNTLTLVIPTDWPQQHRACVWFLHDGAGRLLERGCSEPAHWPGLPRGEAGAARQPLDCIVLLAGTQIACHRAALPATARGRSPELMAVALEDSLLEPAPALHYAGVPAVSANSADTGHLVATVARARLEALITLLRELGLRPRSAWPLGLALPPGSALLCGGELTLRTESGAFIGLPLDAQLPAWLDLQGSGPWACAALDPDLSPQARALVQTQHDSGRLQAQAESPERLQPPAGPGLLYGALAPPRAHVALGHHLRPALRVSAGVAGLALLLALAQWAWLGWQAQQLRAAIAQPFRQAFPQAAMVDPLLQMQRQLEGARRAHGYLAGDDFLHLLRPLAKLPPGSLRAQEIRYEGGRVQVRALLTAEGAQLLRSACLQLGISLQMSGDAAPAGSEQALSFTLAPGARP